MSTTRIGGRLTFPPIYSNPDSRNTWESLGDGWSGSHAGGDSGAYPTKADLSEASREKTSGVLHVHIHIYGPRPATYRLPAALSRPAGAGVTSHGQPLSSSVVATSTSLVLSRAAATTRSGTFWLNFQGAHDSAAAAPSREHPVLSGIRERCHRGAEKCLVRSVGQRFGIDQDATQGCPPARPPPFPLQLPLATSHLAMSSRREASHGVSDEGGGRWAFRDRKRSPASTADVRTRTGRPGGMDERKREVWQQRATWHRDDWAGMQHMAHSL